MKYSSNESLPNEYNKYLGKVLSFKKPTTKYKFVNPYSLQ